MIGAAGSPFGQSPRALVHQLLDALGVPLVPGVPAGRYSRRLPMRSSAQHGRSRCSCVIDDLHWADADSFALLGALGGRPFRACLFVVALRSSFASASSWVLERARRLELPRLDQGERERLLRRLLPGEAGAPFRAKLAGSDQGGNPLYLEHAAAYLKEARFEVPLPRSLHEPVLCRLEIVRARVDRRGYELPSPEELATAEQMVGEWLDRLETGDYKDRATTAEHHSLLERIDAGLVIAGCIAGVLQRRNRRLAAAVERFYSASFAERRRSSASLDMTRPAPRRAGWNGPPPVSGSRTRPASSSSPSGSRKASNESGIYFGDLLIARGEPERDPRAYAEAAQANPNDQFRARCERRLARSELARGDPRAARRLLERALARLGDQERPVAACDLAYTQGLLGDQGRAHLSLSEAQAAADTRELRPPLLRTRVRLAVLIRGTDVERIASRCASSLVLEGDAVADLAALIDTTLLLRCALRRRVGPCLIAEATRAAHRLGNAGANRKLRAKRQHR